jgi:hypothetical protein
MWWWCCCWWWSWWWTHGSATARGDVTQFAEVLCGPKLDCLSAVARCLGLTILHSVLTASCVHMLL